MVSIQQFSLRWNNYLKHVTNIFNDLRLNEHLVDVTLYCEGKKIKAHKMLLSACSPYFRSLFQDNPSQHPVIIFGRSVPYHDLLAIVTFMYHGEVNILQDHLASFLTTAELLEVQGLTDDSNDQEEKNQNHNINNLNEGYQHSSNQAIEDEPCIISQTRKRKATFEDEDNQLWENENIQNFTSDNEQINMNTVSGIEVENKNQSDLITPAQNVVSVNENDLQILQASNSDTEFKIVNLTNTISDNLQNPQASNDSTLKDTIQGIYNWKIKEPLEGTDNLQEIIFTTKPPPKSKKFLFETKLETMDKCKVQNISPVVCDICDKAFKHPLSLSHHKKTHKEDIVCKTCSKSFSRNYNLIRHIKTSHTSI